MTHGIRLNYLYCMTGHAERFQIFLTILDAADCEFVERRDARLARSFRKTRARIFRRELSVIATEAGNLFRVRRDNIAAAGRWSAYAPLLRETAGSYWAIAKLHLAATAYSLQLPRVVDAARNADRVLRFITSQTIAANPASLPA